MSLKITDLYNIDSDEFLAVELSGRILRKGSQTNRNRVGKIPTSKLDHILVSDKLNALKLNQNMLAKLASVPRWVVNHFLRGRTYKKSSPRKQLIVWLVENGFDDCSSQNKNYYCTCPHCGSRHKIKKLLSGEPCQLN
jgi:hypothetical protein